MAVPQTKSELLRAIECGYDRLERDLQQVTPQRARQPILSGHLEGTVMSPADLVAYLIGWGEVVLGWHEASARGEEPIFPAPGYAWDQMGDLALSFYRARETDSWADLLARFKDSKVRVADLVTNLRDEDLYGQQWHGYQSAGRMIQFNTSSMYANARRRIRFALREDASVIGRQTARP